MITINNEIIQEYFLHFNDLRKRGISMDFLNLLNDIQRKSDRDVQQLASFYEVNLSIEEIRLLRPLLNDISIHWYFTGIPNTFIHKVEKVIGPSKTAEFLKRYEESINRSSQQ